MTSLEVYSFEDGGMGSLVKECGRLTSRSWKRQEKGFYLRASKKNEELLISGFEPSEFHFGLLASRTV